MELGEAGELLLNCVLDQACSDHSDNSSFARLIEDEPVRSENIELRFPGGNNLEVWDYTKPDGNECLAEFDACIMQPEGTLYLLDVTVSHEKLRRKLSPHHEKVINTIRQRAREDIGSSLYHVIVYVTGPQSWPRSHHRIPDHLAIWRGRDHLSRIADAILAESRNVIDS
jgi:hypothetical protein